MQKQDLNLIPLPPGLIAENLTIARRDTLGASHRQVSGVIRNGHCAVWASVAPGTDGQIDLTFEMEIPSVTAPAFVQLRKALRAILRGSVRERAVARQAGLVPEPPPNPQSVMAAYAAHLYADLFFGGLVDPDADRPFDANDGPKGPETRAVFAVRAANIELLHLSGRLHVDAGIAGGATQVYVPVTVIDYEDGIIVPFAGYAETAWVDTSSDLLPVTVDAGFWRL